jgi:23S rRNA pseudouridine955/2504/2580 synthase
MVNFIEITIPDVEDGRRFDRFLRNFFTDLSQSEIEKLLRSKMIRLNGQKAKADTRLQAGFIVRYPDFLSVHNPHNKPQKSNIIFPKDLILYEDNDLMVINKPHGLAVQGGSNMKIHLDMMLETLPQRNGYRPSSVHRLDKDTSGCLLIAKKRNIAAKLGEALRHKEFKKYYLAITDAIPKQNGGNITNYLAKSTDGNHDIMRIVPADTPTAQIAETLYYNISHNEKSDKALLLLTPITGRTHQLRLHCQSIDSPIMGDGKYNPLNNGTTKLCLHAIKLIFTHPETGKMIDIDAPLPDYFIKNAHKYELSLNNPVSYENKEILHHFLNQKL